jgi:hypothetical protein
MMHARDGRCVRPGAALVVVAVALAMISAMMGLIAVQVMGNRRVLEHRGQQLQAAWLARAGFELACDRLLADAGKYTGETAEPVPRSQVRIHVAREPGAADTFRVTSEARYRTDAPRPVVRSLSRVVQRTSEGGRVRIEVKGDTR